MRNHASGIRRAKVPFLAADLSKVGNIDIILIIRSLMHIFNTVYPMVSSRNKKK